MNLQLLPPELRQFIADVERNAKRYPLEFPPEELELPRRASSATARKDPLGSYWHNQLQQIQIK